MRIHNSRLAGTALTLAILLLGCSKETKLQWNEAGGYRWADLPSPSGDGYGFREISGTGVTFSNTLAEESLLQNRHYMNGSGVAIGDVDGDGWADLYFAGLDGPNILYRNLGGWKFEDVTEEAGVAAPDRFSTGAVFADIDGDTDLDLLVTAIGGPNAAYLNNGKGVFREATRELGLDLRMGSTSMALSDVDGDGDLDLYLANYKIRSASDIYSPRERSFDRTVVREGNSFRVAPEFEQHYELVEHAGGFLRAERAEPNVFYLNDGRGRFTIVPLTGGAFLDSEGNPLTKASEDWTLSVRFHDSNGDGAPDLYICNDFQSPDYFFLGDGKGRFREVPALAVRKTSFSTMSVDFSDVERDGDLDFFLTDMLSREYSRRQTQVGLTVPMTTRPGEIENRPQAVQNMLQLNRGDDTYAEIGRLSGVAASDWTWSGLFLDADLDGYEDLLLATGHLYDVINMDAQAQEIRLESTMQGPQAFRRLLLDFPPLPLKNVAFRNRGDLSFEAMPDGWGLGVQPDVANALAFGDLDNDGDLDAVMNRLNQEAGLFRNEAKAPRVAVRLRGQAPNTQGIGARIRYESDGLPAQEKEVISGGQYLSGSDPVYAFAGGEKGELIVSWRSGRTSRIAGIEANRIYEIYEPTSNAPAISPREAPTKESFFEDASELLSHTHIELPFDDFALQPLLPRRLSQEGPAVSWADLDGDGDDDLLIGGEDPAMFINSGAGGFTRSQGPDVASAGILSVPRGGGGSLLFTADSGMMVDSSHVLIYEVSSAARVRLLQRLPFGRTAVGPLALSDIDGDHDLDLFAGGRSVPGNFPEPSPSRIYRNDGNSFSYDASLSRPFAELGYVSGATFGDLDDDGDADLIVAAEWAPLRYFENDGTGRFADRTESSGLSTFSGLWHGVSLGDFNADGRLDIVATNWGWNGVHERLHGAGNPLRLYYGDFDSDGVLDVLESHFEPALNAYAPDVGLPLLSQAMPFVRQRLPSFERFSRATLQEIIGPRLSRAFYLETGTLSSMIFLNTGGGRFQGRALPVETQFSSAYAAAVADLDSDGHQDIFLSQNFFGLPNDVPRQDAGRGIWLKGAGDGSFSTIPGHVTGVEVYGEQRGAAVADYDGDGRIDFVVAQNRAQTRLFRNRSSSEGLRVRLSGSSGNPAGVGSRIRIKYTDGTLGPAHAVTAGSGYWSQSSSVAVVGLSGEVRSVVVTWPDGRTREMDVPRGTREMTLPY